MALKCYTFFMLALSVHGYEVLKHSENAHVEIEQEHNKYWLNIPWELNGTQYMWNVNGTIIHAGEGHTPNWMMDEPPFRPWFHQFYKQYSYREVNRPYRIYPASHMVKKWNYKNIYDKPGIDIGCYCTTAWKVYTPLAGCAVLTHRHILTTATSTELILKKVRHIQKLDKILGFWYEHSDTSFNNTYYSSVARIHYHPKYLRPENVNISHPLPFLYDLAIWATPRSLTWYTIYCRRAAPSRQWYEHTKPYQHQKILIIGYQYIKAHAKTPNVFFKYATRTPNYLDKCPKVEWGEYFCIGGQTESFAKYGIESGAAYHRLIGEQTAAWWQGWDGLAAMCAFSMTLRSMNLVHYFTVLNVHPVLDWMYDAYTGQQPYVWLDFRFQDSKGRAPVPKSWHQIMTYDWPATKPYEGNYLPIY